MAAVDIHNDTRGWLVLWLEPLGEDRWMRAGERFRVRTDYLGDDPAFAVSFWSHEADRAAGIEHVTVWVEHGNPLAEVTDDAGAVVECGHQRSEEFDREVQARLAELELPARGEGPLQS
jgi:hypothetical protein